MITVYLILVLIFGIITGSSDASYQYNPEEIMYLAGIGKAAYEDDVSYSLYDMNGDGIPELFILNDSGDSGKLLEIYRYDALTNDALLVVSIDKVTDVYSKGDENGVYVSVSDALSEIYTDYELVNNEAEAQTVTKNSGEEHITDLLKNGAEPLFWVGSDQWVDGSIIGAAPRIPDPGPQNDFYLSSNYEWLSTEQIHKQGDITGMTDDQEEIVRRNKQEMFTNREKYQGADIQILRDYYDMAADWEKRDADGIEPVRKYLDAAYGVSSLDELTELLVNPELNPFSILLSFSITLDEEDTSHWAVELGEDNFSVLPRIYHNDSKEAIEEVRSDFDVMSRHVLSRAGYPDPEIDNILAGCYELEDILLPLAWPGDSDTDSPLSGFLPFDTVTSFCKSFPLKQLLNAYEITGGNIHVYYPGYLERLDEIYKEENLFILKAYLTAHTAAAAGMYLDFEAAACLEAADAPEKELKESFETGYQAEVLSSRGLLGVAEENAYMTFFADPETRSDLIELAGKVRDTFRVMLDHEDWMSDSGKAAAIEKLDNKTFCVMSPDVLIDSSYLAPDPDKSFLDNYAAITVSLMKHNGAFAGMPREKGDWRYDLRPEIASSVTNAFYYGVFNQFFILSGFVDDSVCNPDMPIEKKLASIGVIIGHELTHGFDPTGIRYDKDGNMVMTDANPYGWMPEEDYQAFMKRAQRIADHIDTIHPFPYAVCSGSLQWGEAAADFGGMTIALGIAVKIDDFDYDRFFRAYAELWRKQTTLEWERYDIHDSHPLNHLRVNMTLQQFDEFLASYGVKESDGMYPDTEGRIRIW